MGDIRLDYEEAGGNIDAGDTITVTFGSLSISSTGTLTSSLRCGGAFATSGTTCQADITAEAANDEKTGLGTVTIDLSGLAAADKVNTSYVNLSGVRTDVSRLAAGDDIMATISTSAPSGLIPVGQSARKSIGAVVATVKAGLEVGISKASRLICNLDATEDLNDPPTPADPSDDTPVGGVAAITAD